MPVAWKPPAVPGAAHFAYWDGALFGYVGCTAFEDRRWLIKVFPHGEDDEDAILSYVPNEALARKFLERWAEHNHSRIAPAKDRRRMPHEGDPKLTPTKS